MAIRQIIEIDEETCNGCGECANGCPEGALRIIDGKARLVGESLCDGLGACIGTCPVGAIRILEREAEAYDERKVMEGMVRMGPKVIEAHLEHLEHHGQDGYADQARAFLKERGLPIPAVAGSTAAVAGSTAEAAHAAGCPGSRARAFARPRPAAVPPAARSVTAGGAAVAEAPSALSHWPIQLHLINPRAPHYAGCRLLVAADCTAFALGSFHARLLEGKSVVIACPKLDQGRDVYVDKLARLLEGAESVEVAIMEVPCCSGLLKLVLDARERAGKKPAVESVVVGIEGGIVARRSH